MLEVLKTVSENDRINVNSLVKWNSCPAIHCRSWAVKQVIYCKNLFWYVHVI